MHHKNSPEEIRKGCRCRFWGGRVSSLDTVTLLGLRWLVTFEAGVSLNMPLSFDVSGADKDQLVVSLAAILLNDSKVDVSAENINTVVSSSGNSVPAYYPTLFSTYIEKAGGVEKFFSAPSAGAAAPAGGAAPSAGAAAPAAAKAPEKPKEEEVDALDGGMDMFGGGAKTGDY